MDHNGLSLREFANVLASKAPVPGGGGACALVGALGCALGNMVGSLTVGKKKYADVEEEMQDLIKRARALREEFLDLVEADARAFAPLSRAYSLPKTTPEEQAEKDRVMEKALNEACLVPLRVMEKVCDCLDLVKVFAEKGSAIAISDAGVAAAFCRSALSGAQLNVLINTRMMKDRGRAQQYEKQAREYLERGLPLADAVYDQVRERLAQ